MRLGAPRPQVFSRERSAHHTWLISFVQERNMESQGLLGQARGRVHGAVPRGRGGGGSPPHAGPLLRPPRQLQQEPASEATEAPNGTRMLGLGRARLGSNHLLQARPPRSPASLSLRPRCTQAGRKGHPPPGASPVRRSGHPPPSGASPVRRSGLFPPSPPGRLQVLESLLADTLYRTPPMQRKPLLRHRGEPAWPFPPPAAGRRRFSTRDLRRQGDPGVSGPTAPWSVPSPPPRPTGERKGHRQGTSVPLPAHTLLGQDCPDPSGRASQASPLRAHTAAGGPLRRPGTSSPHAAPGHATRPLG